MMMSYKKFRWFTLLFIILWTTMTVLAETTGKEKQETCSADGECTATDDTTNDANSSSSGNAKNNDDADNDDCQDEHEHCAFWASIDECEINPKFMKTECRVSCKTCNEDFIAIPTTDDTTNDTGDDQVENLEAGTDFGVAQRISPSGTVTGKQLQRRVQESRDYLKEASKTINKDIMELCRNGDVQCTLWALSGECEANPHCKYSS
jgi:hypothetical protein